LVAYTRGYLFQKQAAAASTGREKLLEQARLSYEQVLEDSPENGPTLNNLALVEAALLGMGSTTSGLQEKVVRHWQLAIEADPAHAAEYSLSLGDFLASSKKAGEALRYYRDAAAGAPDAEAPRRRILQLGSTMTIGEQLAVCNGWRRDFAAISADCYEQVIARLGGQPLTAGSTAEAAWLGWTSVVSTNNWLASRIKTLPANWNAEPVATLRAFVREPLRDPRAWSWWWEKPYRTSVTAEVAVALGHQLMAQPESGWRRAAELWEKFLATRPYVAEEIAFQSDNRPASVTVGGLGSVLRLYQELGSLYYRHPELDAGGAKLKRITDQLFEGKMQFIVRGDWESTQTFHTTLAFIFMEGGIWGDPHKAASAIYQLQAAIDDANRRLKDPKERFYQPLPELKRMLAEAYLKVSRPSDAASQYLAAASAYLDVDALDTAAKMLDQHRRLAAPSGLSAELGRVLEARRNAHNLNAGEVNEKKMPWLFTGSSSLPPDFLARQQFKILADIASSADPHKETAELDAAFKAYRVLVEQKSPLVGTSDLARWQRAQAKLLSSANAKLATTTVSYDAKVTKAGVPLTLPGETRPLYVAPDQQTEVAAELVSVLGPEQTLAFRQHVQLQHGELIVRQTYGGTDQVSSNVERLRRSARFPVVVQDGHRLAK
jgi:hypothetical protein